MHWNLLRQRELALAVCVSLGVTACGGGGGGSNSRPSYNIPPPVQPATPPSTPSAPAPPSDIQLTATNAKAAQAAGAKGAGTIIGIVDSGVIATNPTLNGKVLQSFSYVDPVVNNTSVGDVVGHGTAVAEVAVGTTQGLFGGGIAPSASIVTARIIADKAPTDDGSGQGNKVTSADPLGKINSDLIGAKATIINNSWGGLYWDASSASTTQSFRDAYSAARFGALFVFAAGNSGQANPSDVAALPNRAPELERGWLTVVALDSANPTSIASYSNRCGIAQNYCLAAPGSVVTLAANATAANPSYEVWSGTSFAAPQVAAGAAVVSGVFPTLSKDAVRQIILGTADDLGAPGPDPVYGYGRLNVGRAIGGPGTLDWGPLTINLVAGSDVTFSNDISGTGGLTTSGNARLVLTSKNNSYSGGSIVGEGTTLESMGRLPGAVTILPAQSGSPAGQVIAHGDIGGNVLNQGRLQTTDAGTTITGNFVQGSTGTLAQVLGAPLIVNGTASLNGQFYISGVKDKYVPASHQQVLTASSVSGQFAGLSTAPGIYLQTTLQYAPTEVWVDTSHISVVKVAQASMPASLAAQSSATRVDAAFAQIDQSLASSAGNVVANGTLSAAGGIQQSRSTAQAQASLESLSGQLYAAGTAVTLAGIDAGNDALMSHLDAGTTRGSWAQSLNDQGGMSRAGFGNVGFNLSGGMIGQDVRIGSNGFAGVTVATMRSTGQLSGNFDRQRNRSTEGSFYAGTQGANWYGVGRVGYGSFRGDTRRLLRFGDQAATFAGGDINGSYNSAYGELGYRTQVGAFSLTPFANVQYASIHRSGFQEIGGDGFGLTANDHTTSRWQAGVCVRAGASWFTSYGKLRLDMKLGWQNAFATRGEVFAARYTGFSQWAPVEGIGLSRSAATAGLQLGWDMNERTQLAFGMDQRFADRDHSHSASASVRVAW